MIKYIFTHPIKENIEIWAEDWYEAQLLLLQEVKSIMDWELYIDDLQQEIALFI